MCAARAGVAGAAAARPLPRLGVSVAGVSSVLVVAAAVALAAAFVAFGVGFGDAIVSFFVTATADVDDVAVFLAAAAAFGVEGVAGVAAAFLAAFGVAARGEGAGFRPAAKADLLLASALFLAGSL